MSIHILPPVLRVRGHCRPAVFIGDVDFVVVIRVGPYWLWLVFYHWLWVAHRSGVADWSGGIPVGVVAVRVDVDTLRGLHVGGVVLRGVGVVLRVVTGEDAVLTVLNLT